MWKFIFELQLWLKRWKSFSIESYSGFIESHKSLGEFGL